MIHMIQIIADTTVGYQYDGLTEEDRFVQKKVLQEHYDKVYKENLRYTAAHRTIQTIRHSD